MEKSAIKQFRQQVLSWYAVHGRKHLPWQQQITPYTVWLSEIMLQQTQVQTVIPYFKKFLTLYPTIHDLAAASLDEVLAAWAGLGYYARARNLHKTAAIISEEKQGHFPDTVETLSLLPGIGLSTAGAIVALAFQKRASILDGNVKRVLSRYAAIEGWVDDRTVLSYLWDLTTLLTPQKNVRDYTQAMMDLGAMVCFRTNPHCEICPLKKNCLAYRRGEVEKFPGKKPAKSLPVKQTVMVVVEAGEQEVLLQKRPLMGIWGGLWSLPQFDNLAALKTWFHRHFQGLFNPEVLLNFRHTFTHFHLDIEAISFVYPRQRHLLQPLAQCCDEKGCFLCYGEICWVGKEVLPSYGKPVPTEKILRQYLGRVPRVYREADSHDLV